jgi:transcriptional regulator with XRE-family HTH domain
VTIKNRWKLAFAKSEYTQLDMARMLEIDTPTMSRIVKGDAMLPKEKFERACESLNVPGESIYDADILNAVYRMGITKPKPTTVSVRIGIEYAQILDEIDGTRREIIERLIGDRYGVHR